MAATVNSKEIELPRVNDAIANCYTAILKKENIAEQINSLIANPTVDEQSLLDFIKSSFNEVSLVGCVVSYIGEVLPKIELKGELRSQLLYDKIKTAIEYSQAKYVIESNNNSKFLNYNPNNVYAMMNFLLLNNLWNNRLISDDKFELLIEKCKIDKNSDLFQDLITHCVVINRPQLWTKLYLGITEFKIDSMIQLEENFKLAKLFVEHQKS